MAVRKNNAKGVVLAELLVVIAIITTTLAALVAVVNFSLSEMWQKKHSYQANFLASQALEALRNIKDNTDWLSDGLGGINTDQIYHLEKSGSPQEWQLAFGQRTIGIFTETITFDNVFRDVSQNIAASGALDSDSRQANAAISWLEKGQTRQVVFQTVFTNWQ